MAEKENENVIDCVQTVNTNFPCTFILVGGASLVKFQSNRTTTDVDVVVPPSTDIYKLIRKLTESGWFYLDDGVLFVKPTSPSGLALKLDILTEIVDDKTFDDLNHSSFTSSGINTIIGRF